MKNKSIILCIILVLCIALPLSSVDFGLNIGNISDFSIYIQNEINQTNTATLWFTAPIKDFSFAASVVYKFNYYWNPVNSVIRPYQFDIGNLEFSGILELPGKNPSGIRFDVGRIQAQDITGKIFSVKSDGLNAAWLYNNITIGVQSYYTGLTLKNNSSIILSTQDAADRKNNAVVFASPRLVYSAYASFQELFLLQNISVEFLGQNDLRADADQAVNTYYGTVLFSGPLISTLRYSAGTSLGIYQSGQSSLYGQLITASLSMRIPEKAVNLSLIGIFTPSWGNDNPIGFVPVNSQSVSTVLPEIKHDTVSLIGFESLFQQSSVFSHGYKASGYLNKTLDSFALPVLDPSKPNLFIGAELSAYGNFVVSSEFSFMYSAGLFVFNPFSIYEGVNILPIRVALSATLKI